jgi:ABC-type transporter Mla MlaB component
MSYLLPAQIKMSEAANAAAAAVQAVVSGERHIDCSALTQFDSAALSVLLAAKRAVAAQATPESLRITGYPDKLHQLAQLYGIDSLLFSGAP